MRKLKEIIVSPINPVQLGKDINVVEEKKYDLSHLSPEQQTEAFKVLNKFMKTHKHKGVIALKGPENYLNVCIQLNSGANKKNVLSFPEPSISRIYYRMANEDFEYALNEKNKLLQIDASDSHAQYNSFIHFVRFLSSGCIMTIASLEAFMNSVIPFDAEFEINNIKMQKSGLEYLDFNTKMTNLMPLIFQKEFHIAFPYEYSILSNCNSFRDDFIHLKKEYNENKTIYEQFLKRAYDAPILKISESAFKFVNYFIENYFEILPEKS